MKRLLIIKALIGLWLILSGFILGFYEVSIPNWNNIIVGILLILLTSYEYSEKDKQQSTTQTPTDTQNKI